MPSVVIRSPSASRIRGCSRTRAVKNVRDVAPGVGAARVHDAGARVAAFAAEAVVEADAEAAQLGDPGGSLGRQELDRADGRQMPRPAESVSAAWRAGSSSGPTAAATPPWAA